MSQKRAKTSALTYPIGGLIDSQPTKYKSFRKVPLLYRPDARFIQPGGNIEAAAEPAHGGRFQIQIPPMENLPPMGVD